MKAGERDPVPGLILLGFVLLGMLAWWIYAAAHCRQIGETASGEPVLECK